MQFGPFMKILPILLLALPVCALAQTAPKPENKFVGSTVCKTCHPDVWLNFNKNPHFKSVAYGHEAPDKTGCEGCHGPGGDHVAAGGGKPTIRAFSLMSPDQGLNTCLGSHSKDIPRANIRRSA